MAALALGGAACGGSAPARPAGPRAVVHLDGVAAATSLSYGAPSVVDDGHGGYLARLRRSRDDLDGAPDSVEVRLNGLGYPGEGRRGSQGYIGPGVTLPWSGRTQGRYAMSFRYTGKQFALRVWSRGGQWRLRVDGDIVGPPRTVGSDSSFHTLGVSLAGTRSGIARTVEVQLEGGAYLAGLTVDPGSRLSPTPRRAAPRVYWLGDSFFAGSGALHPGFDDLVHVAADRLGFEDATVDALGGTGYAKDNEVGGFPDFLTRARTNLRPGRAHPDVIVVGGSINDARYPPGEVGRAAGRLYAYLRRRLPDTKVFVVPFTPRYPVPANFKALDAALRAAAARAPNVAGVLDLPHVVQERIALLGTPAASLAREDGHPTPAAHALYGRLISAFLRAHLASGRR